METNTDQSLRNKEKLENQLKPQQSEDVKREDSDPIKKLEDEWHPVRDKIVNEEKTWMSAKDLFAIKLETACKLEMGEDEQDRCGTDRREFRQKIFQYVKLKNCEID